LRYIEEGNIAVTPVVVVVGNVVVRERERERERDAGPIVQLG
jgi:hypothetical protein